MSVAVKSLKKNRRSSELAESQRSESYITVIRES